MGKLEEIRQRYENLPPWEDDSEDVRYLLSEIDRLNCKLQDERKEHAQEYSRLRSTYIGEAKELTARAEAAEARADAAVEDLKRFSACCQCNANIDGSCCDMFDGTAENKYFCSNWQWRGSQAGEGAAPNE